MTAQLITIGSRGSALAMVQARLVREAFTRADQPSQIVVIETEGDRRGPDTAWGEGAFVAAIERALVGGEIHVAVHSAKDVPTGEDPRLRIGAYLPRADPRDALIVRAGAARRRLDDLPPGSRIGTDSPRRTGFLLARRPDLAVHPLHGNVDTRLRRLAEGETDALVLACAGLDRLGLGDLIDERLDPAIVPPAPGQGAIAVQARNDDVSTLALLSTLDHRPTRLAVEAERAFLAASGGGCRSPIGALVTLDGDELVILGGHVRPDGTATALARRRGAADAGTELGRELALQLDARNGNRARRAPGVASSSPPGPRVLLTRAADQADELVSRLELAGLDPVLVPAIAIELEPLGGELDAAARRLGTYAWAVVTSANGARAIVGAASRGESDLRRTSWAAIGPATRRVLEAEGIEVALQPSRSNGTATAAEVPLEAGDRVLVVRGDLADEAVALMLRARGAEVDDVIAYRTQEAPEASRPLLRRALAAGSFDAVLFTSGSTVRGLVALAGAESIEVSSIPSVCIGPETATAAAEAGFRVLAVSPTPDSAALATATADALALRQESR
ncbi:MAG TPA: hydroxymethylbilane synthase [Candidatus Limnocylindria bacterium]|nr:hydroxymethylbilane synthase [Candidatus Limnocylindria bacterium]